MITLSKEAVLLRLPDGEDHTIMAADVAELKPLLLTQNLDRKEDVSERLVVIECQSDVKYDLYYKVISIIQSTGGLLALVEEDLPGQSGGGN